MSKTKNTLVDLNNLLFEQLERLNDDELSQEELEQEINRSKAMTDVAKTVIDNASLAFSTMKHMDEYGYRIVKGEAKVPDMLEVRE